MNDFLAGAWALRSVFAFAGVLLTVGLTLAHEHQGGGQS